MKKRAKITVQGRVQGVNFRHYTMKNARSLNLTGYVKNLPNGDVETEVEGEETDILEFLDAIKSGPPPARVTHTDVNWLNYEQKYNDFRISY